MKKMMCLLMLMTGCGTDDGVSVNCEQAGSCPVTATVKTEATIPAPAPVAKTVAAQTVETKVEAEVSTPIEEPISPTRNTLLRKSGRTKKKLKKPSKPKNVARPTMMLRSKGPVGVLVVLAALLVVAVEVVRVEESKQAV